MTKDSFISHADPNVIDNTSSGLFRALPNLIRCISAQRRAIARFLANASSSSHEHGTEKPESAIYKPGVNLVYRQVEASANVAPD
jgi:hypothetical protein